MAGNGWKLLDMADEGGMVRIDWKLLEMAGNG